jgi:hypothetical protein
MWMRVDDTALGLLQPRAIFRAKDDGCTFRLTIAEACF